MTLDVHTLFLVTIYVEAILGLLLLFVWAQNMALRGVCWWGFAHLVRLSSIGLFGMYGSVPDLVSIDLANALLFTAFAVTWTGARVFDGRPVEPVYLVTGAVLWLLICRLPLLVSPFSCVGGAVPIVALAVPGGGLIRSVSPIARVLPVGTSPQRSLLKAIAPMWN